MTENGTQMYMPVAPAYGGGGGGFGFGDGNGWWLILLLLVCGNGLWGGFGGGMGGMMWPMMMGGMGAGMGLDYLYPWLNNSEHISGGFRDQQIQSTLAGIQSGITSGFGDVQLGIAGVNQNICQTGNSIQNALCTGFAGTTAAITGAQNAIAQQLYGNEIASLNRSFAEQTANTAGFTGVQSSLCDIRYGSATNTRDIIDNQNRNSQAILDKLCALELDGVKGQLAAAQRENTALQNQVNMAAFRESQANQNALFQQGMNAEVDALYNRLSSCPVPTTPVYGRTPIFTCGGQNVGCGCGGNGFAA